MAKLPEWVDGLKTRAANALIADGITSKDDLALRSRRELRNLPNLGPVSLREIENWMGEPFDVYHTRAVEKWRRCKDEEEHSKRLADAAALLRKHGFTVIGPK